MSTIVPIDGENALFLKALPNWNRSVEKTWEYKTDLFASQSGNEQRRALRSSARSSFSYSVSYAREDFRTFMQEMAGWQRRLFLVPDPVRNVPFIQAMSPGVNTTLIAVVPAWLRPGTRVALEYKGTFAYRRLLDVQGSQLVFDSIDGSMWPTGTKMHPLHEARLLSGVPSKSQTSTVAEATLDFSVEPLSDNNRVLGQPDGFFDGQEIFLKRPNWASPVDIEFSADLDVLDYDRGARFVADTTNFSARLQKLLFLNRDQDEADQVEAFFHRMKGRRGGFYLPSWTKDMQPVLDAEVGTQALLFDEAALEQMLSNDPAHRRLILVTRNGEYFPNEIENILMVEGGYGMNYGLSYGQRIDDLGLSSNRLVLITLRDPWPRTILKSEIVYCSWLMAVRFASDMLTFTYETDEVSQFQLSVQQIKDADASTRMYYGWGYGYGYSYGGRP